MESLLDYIGQTTRSKPMQQKTVSEKIVDKSIGKIVANGTKKYQYMMCSDGAYRYFTDEQFKDPNTGSTNRSEDYCKANNYVIKVKLTDSPDGLYVIKLHPQQ